MSLKSLIQWLLDSRTTPEEAGHSAMPTTPEITSQSFAGPFGSWGPVASGTASEDGYIYAAGAVATSGSNSEFRLDNGQFGSYITSTWGTQGLLLPVMKGQSWRLYATNRKDVVIRLYRLVGGGYNSFVWRALSCLRVLSNYLQRGFCKINIQTLPINAAQVQQLRINQSREVANKTSLLHLVVGPYFRLAGIMHLPISGSGLKTPQERLATYQTRLHLGSGLQFQSRKETPSSLILVLTQAQGVLSLFVTNRLNNFASGGEAC